MAPAESDEPILTEEGFSAVREAHESDDKSVQAVVDERDDLGHGWVDRLLSGSAVANARDDVAVAHALVGTPPKDFDLTQLGDAHVVSASSAVLAAGLLADADDFPPLDTLGGPEVVKLLHSLDRSPDDPDIENALGAAAEAGWTDIEPGHWALELIGIDGRTKLDEQEQLSASLDMLDAVEEGDEFEPKAVLEAAPGFASGLRALNGLAGNDDFDGIERLRGRHLAIADDCRPGDGRSRVETVADDLGIDDHERAIATAFGIQPSGAVVLIDSIERDDEFDVRAFLNQTGPDGEDPRPKTRLRALGACADHIGFDGIDRIRGRHVVLAAERSETNMGELEPVADEFDIDDHELAIGNVSGVSPSAALEMIDALEREDEVDSTEFLENSPGAKSGVRALGTLADRDDFDGIDRIRGRHVVLAAERSERNMGELEPVADEFDIDDHELAIGNVSGVGPSTALDMIDSIERDDEVADDEFIESAPGAMTGLRALNHLADRDDFDGIDRIRGRHVVLAADVADRPIQQVAPVADELDIDDHELAIGKVSGVSPSAALEMIDALEREDEVDSTEFLENSPGAKSGVRALGTLADRDDFDGIDRIRGRHVVLAAERSERNMGELEPVADEFDIDDHELAIGNVSGVGPSTALDMIDSIERDDEVADDEFIESAPGAMTGLRALNHLADRDDFDGIDRVRGRHAAIAADSHTPLRQGSALRSFTDRAVEAGLIPADDCETDIATMPGLKPADARAVFDLIGGGEAVGTDDIRAAVDIDDMLQIQEIAATIRETHGGNAEGVARDRGQEASEDQFGP